MRKKVLKKFYDRTGESISETLVALLISTLALVMLASAITTTTRIVKTSQTKMDTFYEANNMMIEGRVESSVKMDSASFTLSSDDSTKQFGIYPVEYYYHNVLGNKQVTVYNKQ